MYRRRGKYIAVTCESLLQCSGPRNSKLFCRDWSSFFLLTQDHACFFFLGQNPCVGDILARVTYAYLKCNNQWFLIQKKTILMLMLMFDSEHTILCGCIRFLNSLPLSNHLVK